MCTANARRFLANRLFYQGFLSFDGNDELGLDLRSTIGGAYGKYLVQSPRQEWAAYAGSARSARICDTDRSESLEAVLGTSIRSSGSRP